MHVAIVTAPYDRLILNGHKTVECRLTKTALPPFGCIAPGERIYFKRSSGPFFAVARANWVLTLDELTPAMIDSLRKCFDKVIRGSDAYYASHRDAKFATLVGLGEVTASPERPRYEPRHMRAWITIPSNGAPRSTAAKRK